MDTLTQIALGATVAEAGFRHRLGGKAVVLGAACGLAPDLDMVARLGGEFASMVHHRGITHSLLFLTVMAPLVGYAGWRWSGRRDRWLWWTHLAFWALITHPLLDWCTTYGTQLFAPVSNRRYALDAVSIVDLVASAPLLGVALWSLVRWRREAGPKRHWWARGALVWTTTYLLIAFALSQAVVRRAERQLRKDGFAPRQVRATPTALMTGAWRVVARDRHGSLRLGAASSYAGSRIAFERYPRPGHPLVDKALASPRGAMFRWFTGDMLRVRVRSVQSGHHVICEDVRFGLLSDFSGSVFRLRFDFDRSGKLQRVSRLGRPRGVDLGRESAVWWRVLTTGSRQ